eukprot:765736-Hanusia_phi.AAC.9
MLPVKDTEEMDIKKQEEMPLNLSYKDIESLNAEVDGYALDNNVEAIDFHVDLRNKNMNFSMFNLSRFFHPKNREDTELVEGFKNMSIHIEQEAQEKYEDIEGQISIQEQALDLQSTEPSKVFTSVDLSA